MKKHRYFGGDTLVEVMFAIGLFSFIAIGTIALMSNGTSKVQNSLEITMTRNEIDAEAEALRYIQSAYISEQNHIAPESQVYDTLWNDIKSLAVNNTSIADAKLNEILNFSPSTCTELYDTNGQATKYGFVVNYHKLNQSDILAYKTNKNNGVLFTGKNNSTVFRPTQTYPRILFNNVDSIYTGTNVYSNLTAAEGIYIIAVRDTGTTTSVNDNTPTTDRTSAFIDFYIRSCWQATGSDAPTLTSTVVRLYDPDIEVVSSELITYSLVYYVDDDPSVIPPQTANIKNTFYTFSLRDNDVVPDQGPNKKFLGWVPRGEAPNCKNATFPNKAIFPTNTTLKSKKHSYIVQSTSPIMELDALWSCRYSMKYMPNGDNVTNMPNDSFEAITNEPIYNIKISNTIPNRNTWKFYGWSTNPNTHPDPNKSQDKIYKNGEDGPGLGAAWTGYEQETELHAIWGREYSLKYDKNLSCNVTNMPNDVNVISMNSPYIFKADSGPMCEGYSFKGWSTDKDAKSTDTTLISSGDNITVYPDNSGNGSMTLYAIWIKDSRDTAFLLDVTGSMSSFIRSNASTIKTLVKTVLDGGYQAAFYFYESSSTLKCDFGICNNNNLNFLNGISTYGGTENVYSALLTVLNNKHWVPGTNTIIVLTDERGDDRTKISSVVEKALKIDTVNIYVFCPSSDSVMCNNYYSDITSKTGGKIFTSTNDLANFIDELKQRK